MTSERRSGVLFDVDGTLIDSTYLHSVAWWQAFRRAGHDVVMARVHRAIGMGADQLIPRVLDHELADGEAEDLAASHDAIYATHWPALRVLPGARELIRYCHDSGLRTVLASSAGADEVSVVRDLLGVDDWLDEFTSSADSDKSKPAPDLVQVALDKVGLAPADVVFIGDAVADVEACRCAGVSCVTVTCGGTSADELRDAGADEVHDDPAALLDARDTSALGRLAQR